MTPSELRAIRKRLDLTQAELGAALGVMGRAVRRWETDAGRPSSRIIPVPIGRIVRLMADMPALVGMLSEAG